MLICSLIRVCPKQRVYTKNDSNKRKYTRIYYLPDQNGVEVKVCKTLFKATFAVSDGRLTRALSGKPEGATLPTDKRGRQPCPYKTSEEKINEIKEFISKYPTYSSHYSRNKNPSRKYLPPNLNLTILYNLYKEECSHPVRPFIFKNIFNREFNLSFHAPLSDTCKKCDALEIKLKAAEEDEIASIEADKQLHLRKAEEARSGMKTDADIAKTDADLKVIAFDLMKTLPTPVLSVGTAYYKRQLWTYCLGIHNLSTNSAQMYVWNESQASRGPDEIGSCLIHYIKNNVTTEKLTMYSDQCGGQNRNIKIVAFCTHIVNSDQYCVKEIDHKFLVSGHSFLPCDQDFGLIEKQKRYFKEIFVPSDWIKVIEQARKKNPFKIVLLDQNMIKSSKEMIENNITNRKINADKCKVQWLKMQWIHAYHNHPYQMFYKYSNNEDVPFFSVNISKRKRTEVTNLQLLYPNGRPIDTAKYNDLQSLLLYVPPIHHQFYKNIKTLVTVEDNGLADGESDDSDD